MHYILFANFLGIALFLAPSVYGDSISVNQLQVVTNDLHPLVGQEIFIFHKDVAEAFVTNHEGHLNINTTSKGEHLALLSKGSVVGFSRINIDDHQAVIMDPIYTYKVAAQFPSDATLPFFLTLKIKINYNEEQQATVQPALTDAGWTSGTVVFQSKEKRNGFTYEGMLTGGEYRLQMVAVNEGARSATPPPEYRVRELRITRKGGGMDVIAADRFGKATVTIQTDISVVAVMEEM